MGVSCVGVQDGSAREFWAESVVVDVYNCYLVVNNHKQAEISMLWRPWLSLSACMRLAARLNPWARLAFCMVRLAVTA